MYYHLSAACTVVAVELSDAVVLAGRAVVAGEDDEGVVEDAATLQLVDDASNVLVHAVNHGGMNLHVGRLESLVWFVCPLASGGIRGDGHLIGTDESQLLHTLIATLAQDVPSLVVLTFVLRYVLRLCLNRPMRFLEGDVHEEGLAVGGHLVHHVDGLVCHEVGIVEVLGNALCEDGVLVVDEREGVEVVSHAPDGSPVLVEASVAGIGIDGCEGAVAEVALVREPLHLVAVVADALREREVPLATHASVVACFAEHFGDGNAVLGQAESHACDADGLCVASRHELCSGGATAARVVELCEAHTR